MRFLLTTVVIGLSLISFQSRIVQARSGTDQTGVCYPAYTHLIEFRQSYPVLAHDGLTDENIRLPAVRQLPGNFLNSPTAGINNKMTSNDHINGLNRLIYRLDFILIRPEVTDIIFPFNYFW